MKNTHNGGFSWVAPSSVESLVELQAAALAVTVNAVVITDQTGTVTWVNTSFERLTGYTYAEIVGQKTSVLKSGQNSQSLYEEMWRTILRGNVWRGELINRRKDGSLYDEEMTITPVQGRRGEITHYIAIKLDISERKSSEMQRYMLGQAVENSSELMAMTDPELRITFANRALIHALGYSEEKDLLGKPISVMMSPRNSPEMFSEIAKHTMEGGVWKGECLHVRADGTDYPISLNTNVVKDSTGRILGTLGIGQDIAERKRVEEELKNSESKHRALFENSADAHLLSNDKGFVDCNSALLQMFGYSTKAEIMALHPSDLSPPNQPDGTPSRESADQKVAAAVLNGKNRFEWLHRRKNGQVFPAEVSLTALTLNGQAALLGTVLDITERRKMQNRFRQLATIVECSDDAIISKALDGTIETWNGGAERMYEYSAAEAVGKSISIIFPDEKRDESSTILETMKRDETVRHVESIRKTRSGKQIHIDLTVSPIKDMTGRIVGASTIARDVTERVRAEERMVHLAHYDALTDLPNRVLLMDRLNQLTKAAQRRNPRSRLSSSISTGSRK